MKIIEENTEYGASMFREEIIIEDPDGKRRYAAENGQLGSVVELLLTGAITSLIMTQLTI